MPTPMICPRCGGESHRRSGSVLSPRGRVQRFQCHTCEKKWHPSLRTQPLVLREGFLDVESSQLTGSFGHIISWAVKERGGKIFSDVLRHNSLNDEKRLLRGLLRTLRKFDKVITWYGAKFDIPMIRTRCLYHGLEFPEYAQLYHTDAYYLARFKLKMHSNRLAAVAEFLGIGGKTRVDPAYWVAASFGDRKARSYILAHNREDVKVLEAVYAVLEPHSAGRNTSV